MTYSAAATVPYLSGNVFKSVFCSDGNAEHHRFIQSGLHVQYSSCLVLNLHLWKVSQVPYSNHVT